MAAELGHKFTVNRVYRERSTHIRVNVKKRRVKILFKTATSDRNVNIAYIESNKCSPQENLFIADRSKSLPENAFFGEEDSYIQLSSRVFTTRARRFLVTDVFTTALASQVATPLFYYHTLQNFNSSLDDWDSRELLTLEFIDAATMKPYTLTEYYLNTTYGRIYNNVENIYVDDVLDATFVRYSVRVTSGGSSSVYSYQELVDNHPAFEQATVADLDDWGNLISGCGAYLVEDLPGSTYYRITLPPGTTVYAYKEIAPSKIFVMPPTETELDMPWNVRISNGEFMSSIRAGEAAYRSSKYYLAEFMEQPFSPYYPYKSIDDERAVRVSGNLIKVDRNIYLNADKGIYLSVLIFDSDNILESAFSTDPSLIDQRVNNNTTVTYKDLIASIDTLNGFIEVNAFIPSDKVVKVSYFTEADEYDFTDVDFNPLNNQDVLNKKIVLYINPETVMTGALTSSIHYLEVDRLGRVKYCSQADDGGIDPATTKLLAEDFYGDGSPRHDIYYDIISTQSGLRSRCSGIFSTYQDEFSFLDKYSVESVLGRIVAPSGEFVANLQENPGFLVLADIKTDESTDPSTSQVIDVRVRGGGIREGYDYLAKLQEPESQCYWDKEFPYPGGTAFVVELPQSLLQSNGGDYTLDQLRELTGRHAGFGAYQIAKTYGLDPTIVSGFVYSEVLSGIVVSGLVEFMWTSYGEGTEYEIMMSTNKDSDFEAYNPYTIPDTFPTNYFTISGLFSNITYYAYLEATKDEEVSTGPKIKFTTVPYDTDGET